MPERACCCHLIIHCSARRVFNTKKRFLEKSRGKCLKQLGVLVKLSGKLKMNLKSPSSNRTNKPAQTCPCRQHLRKMHGRPQDITTFLWSNWYGIIFFLHEKMPSYFIHFDLNKYAQRILSLFSKPKLCPINCGLKSMNGT